MIITRPAVQFGFSICCKMSRYAIPGAYIPVGLGVFTPLKICRSQSMFRPRPPPQKKMSHSFIQNCRWITLQVSHHQRRKIAIIFNDGKVNLIFRGA